MKLELKKEEEKKKKTRNLNNIVYIDKLPPLHMVTKHEESQL